MRETRRLELKETITNTFLKTVSAFANYDGGEIIFGVADDGAVKGLPDATQACLDIENKINDSISPQPDYTLELLSNERLVKVVVSGGAHKPYLYKSKAYRRNDTSTIEVDSLEFSRLVLEGQNIRFEELPSREQNLTFEILQQKLKTSIQIKTFDHDILKTLNLYDSTNGYNNAAAVLADHNQFPGIDLAKFGDSISVIEKRASFTNISILSVFEKSMELFRDYYEYEEIHGADRKTVEKIPEAAFREAIANALIHRAWDVQAQIRVLMFDDRIEIISPGGLPAGITEEEYLSGRISVLRNVAIANVFYRLGLVEIFGTGIVRIRQLYADNLYKPEFEVTENTISMVLPLIAQQSKLTEDEHAVYQILSKNVLKSMGDIVPNVPFGKSKVTQLLKKLEKKGLVQVEGKGRGTKYLRR